MGMMGSHGHDNFHQNYNMNYAPLEFKSMQSPPPLHIPQLHPNPPIPKEIPPMTIKFDLRRDKLEIEKGQHNKNNNLPEYLTTADAPGKVGGARETGKPGEWNATAAADQTTRGASLMCSMWWKKH